MKSVKAILPVIFLFLISLTADAQDGKGTSFLSETMRSNGRIYVVIAVMVTILAGLFLYLIRIDRKIGRLEKNP